MNKIFLFSTGLFFLIVSCNSNEDSKTETANDELAHDSVVSEAISPVAGCYLMIQKKDTAILNFDVLDSNVSGKLEYRRFEKDDNNGVISGIIRGDQVIANYIFQSEGMRSVREVVFLINGDSLFEGYGEIEVKGDTAKFKNKNQLKFLTVPFVKVDCAVQ